MIVPPFAGVTLVEYRDRIELTPVYWYREIVGLGRRKASEIEPQPGGGFLGAFFKLMSDREIWVVVRWKRFEDGREEAININYLDADATEEGAKKQFDRMVDFANMSREKLEELTKLFKASDDDLAYIEERFPTAKMGPPVSGSIAEDDLYQARLKVFAGMQPKTVEMMRRAEAAKSQTEREKFEREAIGAYFAEMAHSWTEDMVKEWQLGNPVGTQWMREFARVMEEPEREIDPINYELALNWLRQKYNLMTPEELSDAILIRTGQRVMPGTLKKKRQRLELTVDRLPGPPPKEGQ